MTELWLPYPPSANHLWKGGRGRVFPSAAYEAWKKDATDYANGQELTPVKGLYKLFVTAVRPDKRKRDLDNIIKPISDLLKTLGVIEDDHLCDVIHARWVSNGDGVAVRVEPAGVE